VCKVEFELSEAFRKELRDQLNDVVIPQKAILTRFYEGKLEFEYDTQLSEDSVDSKELTVALDTFAKGAHRIATSADGWGDENVWRKFAPILFLHILMFAIYISYLR
jgi:hypothetical protein